MNGSTSNTGSLVLMFCGPLEAAGLQYMVTGSIAGMIYGEPRLTHDVDVVLVLPDADASRRLLAAFSVEEFDLPPLEVVRNERGPSNLSPDGGGGLCC